MCVCVENQWMECSTSLVGDLKSPFPRKQDLTPPCRLEHFDPCESSVTTPSHTPNLHQPYFKVLLLLQTVVSLADFV